MKRAPDADHVLILYDGVCAFCDSSVHWLLDRDPKGVFRFAPLQGGTAQALRARHPEIPEDIDTLVVVDAPGGDERVQLRAQAVLRILEELPSPWSRFRALRVLPVPLLDLAYRAFARLRYRLFGRLDACRIPSEDERARMLP